MTFFTVFLFSVILQQSFVSLFTEYAGIILGGLFGLIVGYLGYLTLQRRLAK